MTFFLMKAAIKWKIDKRADIFSDGKILMDRENNGKWTLPGGWSDVD